MSEENTPVHGSWVLQGCLFGSVALFVVLLLIMIFLALQRFREHTAEPDPTARDMSTPAGDVVAAAPGCTSMHPLQRSHAFPVPHG